MKLIVKNLHADLNKALKEVAEKYGLAYVPGTLKYGERNAKMSFEVIDVNELSASMSGTPHGIALTQTDVVEGFAPVGTRVVVNVGGGQKEMATILKVNPTRYIIKCDSGKQGSIRFGGCTLK